MKILITGSRFWSDIECIANELKLYHSGTILVHGAAQGADTIAAVIGSALMFDVRPYPARWQEFGKRAGVLRNQQMLDEEHISDELIDICLAFHDDIMNSKGTKDMIRRVVKNKIIYRLFKSLRYLKTWKYKIQSFMVYYGFLWLH